MNIVTTFYAGQPRGLTASTFSTLSKDPNLVLVTLPRSSRATTFLKEAPFAINVVPEEQSELAEEFTGPFENGGPVFDSQLWELNGETPQLHHARNVLICRPWNIYDGGDHVIVIGQVDEPSS